MENQNNIKVTLYNGEVVETPRQSLVVEVHNGGTWNNVAVFSPFRWKEAEALYKFLCMYCDDVRMEQFN